MGRTRFFRLPAVLDGQLLGHVAAYGASEVAAKLSRLAVVVAMARFMEPAEIGIAAAALAASEILKSLTEHGVGQRIIAAPCQELQSVCVTAHRIFWMWCLGLFVLQIAVGALLVLFGVSVMVFVLLAVLAGEYLFMPGGSVQCALAMREGKLRQTALVAGTQNVFANLLTAGLVALFPIPFSVAIPKLLSAPIWLVGMRRLRPWRRDPKAARAPIAPFFRFGSAVLGVEVVRALRLQADKLIVGAILGAEALGLYFFAVNAGLGIATSFSSAFAVVLFPHFCSSADKRQALRKALLLAVCIVVPMVAVQALAAPTYVAIVFGEKWSPVAPLVSILCLAAIPAVLWSTASQWLRANDRAGTEFAYAAFVGLTLSAAVALAAPFGLQAVAVAFVATAAVTQIGAAALAIQLHKPALPTSINLQTAGAQ